MFLFLSKKIIFFFSLTLSSLIHVYTKHGWFYRQSKRNGSRPADGVGCPHSTRPPYFISHTQVVFLEKTTWGDVSFPEPCDVWSPPLSACRLESMYVGPLGPTTLAYLSFLFCFDSTLSIFSPISHLLSSLALYISAETNFGHVSFN